MIKLIVSDMDGTLLDNNNKLPIDFFDTLDKLEKRNIKFAVASGRSYCTLYQNFTPRSDDIIYIADNGTCVIYEGKMIYKNILSNEIIHRIVAESRKIQNVHIIFCGLKCAYVKSYDERFKEDIKKYYPDRKIINDFSQVDDEIFKIGICDNKGAINNSYPILNSIFGNELNVVISGNDWTDIMNKDINKGTALKIIQKKLDISAKETMAFGDYYNDIEMLNLAEYSFVMENANDDMKKHGKFIAKSNNENGVIKAIIQALETISI